MSRGLSVLQLVTRRQLRGAEVFAARLSERLVKAGLEVHLAGLYPLGDPPLEADGVPCLDLWPRRARGVDPRLVIRLAREIHRLDPNVLQANGSDTLKYAVLARLVCGRRPRLVYRNISVLSHWLPTPLHRAWVLHLLRSVDRVVAVSERSRRDLVEHLGLDPGAVTVIPRAVETRTVETEGGLDRGEARRRLEEITGTCGEGPLILHVGSFTAEKNHPGLLRVFREIHARYPEARLICLGDGPLRPQVKAWAEQLGVADRVSLPGSRPDAPELLAGADLLVLFSFVEGLPGVVLEAGARGVPVVASDVGGTGEVIEGGVTGLLVAAGDEAACTRAILRLLEEPELARLLGARLRREVEERYALEAVTRRYLDLYRSLLQGSGVSP